MNPPTGCGQDVGRVPAVGVHDGESLAGNDSSDASETMSFGRQPRSFIR